MSSAAIGRNPDAAGQIRGLAIILAGFAEGLGVLAIYKHKGNIQRLLAGTESRVHFKKEKPAA